jgi:TolA-binding protein
MKGNDTPLSASARTEALKEYETFLFEFEIKNVQQAEDLVQLGYLIMAIEENEEKNRVKVSGPELRANLHPYSTRIFEKVRSRTDIYSYDDSLLYQLAHGYEETGRHENAMALLKELVTRFPKSSYYSEARFRIGESYFVEGKYPEASESYMKAMDSNPGSPLTDFISYKMIWSFFKMGDYRKTVDLVVTALNRYSVQQKNGTSVLDIESLSDANWKQVKELIHLATLSIDFWGGAEKARNYFEFHGHVSFENLIYRPLGHLYLSRGKFQEAAQSFQTFLSLYPTHEEAPQFQMDLIDTFQKSEKWDLARQARLSLIENYKPDSPWWFANSSVAREKTLLLRKEILFQQAQSNHAEAQKSKRKEDYLSAITSYQKFLVNFPKEMEAPRIHYFLGEAYYETEQFEQAASAYEISAYQFPLHTFSHEAASAALVSYEKAALKAPGSAEALRLALLKSCQSFLKAYPHSEKELTVLFKTMTLSFQTGNTSDGRSYARQILETPSDRLPVEIVVKTHFLLAKHDYDDHNYNDAEEAFKQALAWSRRSDYHDSDGPTSSELTTFLASIEYKRAESLKNQLRWKEAASAFYQLYENHPESELAPTSLMNSGSAFLEAKDYDSALNSFGKMTSSYPKSPFFIEAEAALTTLYEKKGRWKDAETGYEVLISRTPDPVKKEHYSDKLYSLYFKDENWSKLDQELGPMLKKNALTPKWLYFYAHSAKELKNESGVLLAVEKSMALLNKKESAGSDDEEWIMKSVLLKGGVLNNRFLATILTSPIEKSLPVKKQRLTETIEIYTVAAQSGYPDIASEALYHIGNLFEQFANDIGRSERPGELTPEQREMYEELLIGQIKPLYQKAIEIYQKNLAFSSQTDNDWIRRSEARYRQLILENKGS